MDTWCDWCPSRLYYVPIPDSPFSSCSCATSFSRTGGILQHTESVFVYYFDLQFSVHFSFQILCRVYHPWLYRGLFIFDSLLFWHAFFLFNDFGILFFFPSWSPLSFKRRGKAFTLHWSTTLFYFISWLLLMCTVFFLFDTWHEMCYSTSIFGASFISAHLPLHVYEVRINWRNVKEISYKEQPPKKSELLLCKCLIPDGKPANDPDVAGANIIPTPIR